jgi:hypothetical protein
MSVVEIVTLLANIALTLTFVVGLIFGIAQIKAAERDRRERLTLETLKAFQSRDFAELIQFVNNSKFPTNQQEIDALPLNQQAMLIEYAQKMESLGILVAENFIDLDLIDKTLGSFVTTTWEKYNVVFSKLRVRDPFIGEYFQWLAEQIETRMKNEPREPFYKNGVAK